MKRVALFLYKRILVCGIPLFRREQVEADLAQLHPGERMEDVKTDYYVKKLTLFLTILLVGFLFGVAAKICTAGKAVMEKEGIIFRGSYEEGSQFLRLKADDGERTRRFNIEVAPRYLTLRETEGLAEEFLEKMGALVLNGNEDFDHIVSDLALEEAFEGYPFTVQWDTDRAEVIDSSGRVQKAEENTPVSLFVTLTYGNFSRTETIAVMVVPGEVSPEEQTYLEMQKYLLATEEGSRDKDSWKLPEEWKGKKLGWSLEAQDNSLIIWAITPAVAILVYLLSDRDIHGELEKKHRRLRREYPELTHKLALYIGAGMTIRGAFQKIGEDYEEKRKKGGEYSPVCEEVLYICRELQSGVSEGAAYEHLGRRTGLREYIKLSSLLAQNLKRGNSTLLQRLKEEAENSIGESLLQVRKMGEEAETKLLVPMVLMLAVVMIIIMVPAFGTL